MTKTKYIFKRIVQIIPIMLIVSILAFGLSNASKGEIANSIIRSQGGQATPEVIEAINEKYGLNKPLPVQYFDWLGKAVRLDFGESFITHQPVIQEIAYRFPNTLVLALLATAFSVIFGILLALISVKYKNKWIDHGIRAVSTIGATVPDFVLALLFLYLFAITFKVFPVISGSKMQNVLLPAMTLSISFGAIYTRMIRNDLLVVMDSEYIKAAKAKGLTDNQALLRHGLKNGVLPCITLIGSNLGYLLAGSFACETIFSWNGIGKFAFESVKSKDLPVIQAYILIVSVTYILMNLAIDIIYLYLDPKMKLA